MKKRNHRKNSIVKPKFGAIFSVNVLILLVISIPIGLFVRFAGSALYSYHCWRLADEYVDSFYKDVLDQYLDRFGYLIDDNEDKDWREISKEVNEFCDDLAFQMAARTQDDLQKKEPYFAFRAVGNWLDSPDPKKYAPIGSGNVIFANSTSHIGETRYVYYDESPWGTTLRINQDVVAEFESACAELKQKYVGNEYEFDYGGYKDGVSLYPCIAVEKKELQITEGEGWTWYQEISSSIVETKEFYPSDVEGMTYIEPKRDLNSSNYSDVNCSIEYTPVSYIEEQLDEYIAQNSWVMKSDLFDIYYYNKRYYEMYKDIVIIHKPLDLKNRYKGVGSSCDRELLFAFPCSISVAYPFFTRGVLLLIFGITVAFALLLSAIEYKERKKQYELLRREILKAAISDASPAATDTIVNKFMAWSEYKYESTPPEPELIGLEKFCGELLKNVEDQFERSKLTYELSTEPENDGYEAYANRTLLTLAFNELIRNALMNSREGSTVLIELKEIIVKRKRTYRPLEGTDVLIEQTLLLPIPMIVITNEQKTMSPESIDGSKKTRRKKKGFPKKNTEEGARLNAVKEMMKLMGGDLKIEYTQSSRIVTCKFSEDPNRNAPSMESDL